MLLFETKTLSAHFRHPSNPALNLVSVVLDKGSMIKEDYLMSVCLTCFTCAGKYAERAFLVCVIL